jgi:hypothetical protein
MLVKDEADIIQSVLEHARTWADRVIVIDNGSTDGTWDAVSSMADEQIVAWRRDLRPYSNALRGDAFNAFRDEAQKNDWWCYKMDSDEFYVDNPRQFLSEVPWPYHVVYKKSLDYVITEEDVEEQELSDSFEENRPLIRYLKPVAYSEPRFFRHRDRLVWPEGKAAPNHRGPRYPHPIAVRHYQFRSPQQMQHRLDVRNAVPRDKHGKPFRHVRHTHWKQLLVPREEAVLDQGRETYEAIPTRVWDEPKGLVKLKRSAERKLHALHILP